MKLVIALCLIWTPTLAQTTYYRDKNGNPLGYTSHEGHRLVERDINGNQTGYWEKEGSSWVHRSKDGNVIERSTRVDR